MSRLFSQNGRRYTVFKIFTSKPTGRRPLGRSRHRWEDNIRIDLKEMEVSTRNWVNLAWVNDYWRKFVNATLNLCVP